jgi:hypothetical protein
VSQLAKRRHTFLAAILGDREKGKSSCKILMVINFIHPDKHETRGYFQSFEKTQKLGASFLKASKGGLLLLLI